MGKGAVVENSIGIMIAVAIMVVIIFLGVKGFSSISNMLSSNQEIKFKDNLYASFQNVRSMGYLSSDSFTIKGHGKVRRLCFVDISQANHFTSDSFFDSNIFQIIESGQTNNVFPIGSENYYNLGEISVDSNNDGIKDNLDSFSGDTNGEGFVCIESNAGYFSFVLTNMGRSVMVSTK